jgi:hypothetical protein
MSTAIPTHCTGIAVPSLVVDIPGRIKRDVIDREGLAMVIRRSRGNETSFPQGESSSTRSKRNCDGQVHPWAVSYRKHLLPPGRRR